MPRAEYEKDFSSAASRAEFAGLLSKAHDVIELGGLPGEGRAASPEAARIARQLVLELGKEALTENATWVLIHRERPLPAPGL